MRWVYALGRYQEVLNRLLTQQSRLEGLQDARLTGRHALLCSQTHTTLGNWDQAAQQAQRSVEAAMQCHDEATLGQAYHVLAMERYWTGHPRQGSEYSQQAIACLEHTKERSRLGMAYFVQGLNALIQRVLGNIARTEGAFAGAEHYLKEALATFAAMHAHFEVLRTHFALSELAWCQGKRETVIAHLTEAYHLFKLLQVPTSVVHTEKRAQELGLILTDDTVGAPPRFRG